MGFISRKMIPAYDSMCVCCPALRSSSRQPVKRYKKLLAEIFPKSQGGPINERRILKLCEYAAKNPLRIPKIASYLEQRCFKELRSDHITCINVVAETYIKLLCSCKEQMAYFSASVLNVVNELLDESKPDAINMIGCQMLTSFIYSQVDGSYTYNIEKLTKKVCTLAHHTGEEHEKCCLRASSLQCLSAMLWFMTEFSHIFADYDKIAHSILDNYNPVTANEEDAEVASHRNWVNEIVRSEGRLGADCEMNSSSLIFRLPPEKKDPSHLTREEIESPKVWVQICIQRMVELAKESTTLRKILDPIFIHFDQGRHWGPQHGLALMVLSDMCYFTGSPGNQQVILSSVIHHLDQKHILHDSHLKLNIIQVATALTRQIRAGAVLSNVGFVSELCRHLRKCLKETIRSFGDQELDLNISLQNAIILCLFEAASGISDPRKLYDIIVMALDKLPSAEVDARATIRSLIILAHMISISSASAEQVFPEALLAELLKAMVHPDAEVRVGMHRLLSALLNPGSNHQLSKIFIQPKKSHSTTASIATLLERLRTENSGHKLERKGDKLREMDITEHEWNHEHATDVSPKCHIFGSILNKTAGSTSLPEEESSIMRLSEDQITQLLSSCWVQVNLPDNLSSNIEAIAQSYCLLLNYSRMKNTRKNVVIRFFQLPLSLWNLAGNPKNSSWSPAYQKLVLVLSTSMLMFAAKLYQIPSLSDLLKSTAAFNEDFYLRIGRNFQLHLKPQADLTGFGSVEDNQKDISSLCDFRKESDYDKTMINILIQNLSSIVELEGDDVAKQLSDPFTPDESFMYYPNTLVNLDLFEVNAELIENLSCDADFMTCSPAEDYAVSEFSVADLSHVVNIGQLLESALVIAGQVAGTSVTASPLPYDTMASQCEALGTCSRQKLSTFLTQEKNREKTSQRGFLTSLASDFPDAANIGNVGSCAQVASPSKDPWLSLRFPPASPFDNFLRAARF